MPQCCSGDACIKAHDRASGAWSGYGSGSLGYGLGTPPVRIRFSHLLQYISGTSALDWAHMVHWVTYVFFGRLGTVWVRVEYAALLVALLATFTGTFASGYHSGRSSAQSPSSSLLVFFFSKSASEPTKQFLHLYSRNRGNRI